MPLMDYPILVNALFWHIACRYFQLSVSSMLLTDICSPVRKITFFCGIFFSMDKVIIFNCLVNGEIICVTGA